MLGLVFLGFDHACHLVFGLMSPKQHKHLMLLDAFLLDKEMILKSRRSQRAYRELRYVHQDVAKKDTRIMIFWSITMT